MKKLLFVSLAFVIMLSACLQKGIEYPVTKKQDVTDEYFGTVVSDPYRWLEDDNSEETKAWVHAQNNVTYAYLDEIPFRNQIKERLTSLWDYKKMGTPYESNGKYYYFDNDGLQNQYVLYVMYELGGEPKVVLDPNKLSDDGTVALSSHKISKDGKYLAYAISRGGSDWNEIYVKNLETGELLEDHIKWVKFSSIAWFKDGFFYSCYDAPNEGEELSGKNSNHKIYYHKIGTSQTEDGMVYQNAEFPLRLYQAKVTHDEKYLFISESESTSGNNLFIKNIKLNDELVMLTQNFNFEYEVIDNVGDYIYILTNYRAPKKKLIRINANSLDIGNWIDILPERKDVLASVEFVNGQIVAKYMQDAQHKLEVYSMKGEFKHEIKLPAAGSVYSFNGSYDSEKAFYSFQSFAYPGAIFSYDINTNSSEVFFQPEVDFNPDDYITEQVFYNSKDGTSIPMFVVRKKDVVLDGNAPTLLYAYGGFNANMMPYFSVSRLAWMDAGGVFALANIRGGGEYGEKWHKQGMKLNKQNVFDDFIYAAKYLIDKKYTSSERLAIQGGSNGGLLIGAVINQAPELFEVAFPEVGVMDMLRFHKFTIGWAWVGEYGSSEDALDFENLYNYSPLHNISDELDYPATMVITADHDDRVVPAHSFKYIATLQEKYEGTNPVLIRIQTNAGHGAGKPTSISIQETADKWSFAFYNMDYKPNF